MGVLLGTNLVFGSMSAGCVDWKSPPIVVTTMIDGIYLLSIP